MNCQRSRRSLDRLFEVPFAESSPIIVSDVAWIGEWATSNGYNFSGIESVSALEGADLFVICATTECYQRLTALREALVSCRVLWMPFAAFHDDTGPIGYGLFQLAQADLSSVHGKQISTANFLGKNRDVRIMDPNGNNADFHIPRSTHIQEAPREPLKTGDFISIISYFEVETEYAAPGCEPLGADGSLAIKCLLHARAASHHGKPGGSLSSSDLGKKVAHAVNCRLELANGFLTSFTIDDLEVAPSIGAMAGERLSRRITEFSVGLNDRLLNPDWTLNSPLNEGVAGVHLGLGDGYSGIHFDFICPAATMKAA